MPTTVPVAGGPAPIDFERVLSLLGDQGREDVAWSETIRPPVDPDAFAREAVFVICNSGMQHVVARRIFDAVMAALASGAPAATAFRHPGKAAAIDAIWAGRDRLLAGYLEAEDGLAFLAGLPWIGGITKYHLAKNLGLDVAKPDVHLVRLAELHGTTPHELCAAIARDRGLRVATVDVVLWRACATRVLCARTGAVLARD